MQLFVRGQNVRALECQGIENISQIKVNNRLNFVILKIKILTCVKTHYNT